MKALTCNGVEKLEIFVFEPKNSAEKSYVSNWPRNMLKNVSNAI